MLSRGRLFRGFLYTGLCPAASTIVWLIFGGLPGQYIGQLTLDDLNWLNSWKQRCAWLSKCAAASTSSAELSETLRTGKTIFSYYSRGLAGR